MPPNPTGYSGTPLAKKLGIGAGTHLLPKHAPSAYAELLQPLPDGVVFDTRLSNATDIVHLFVDRAATLRKELASLRTKIRNDAAVWVSWPKKSSGVSTDITEDEIRTIALPLGFVDVKVCAVDATWSGLRLVIRKQLR